MPECPTCDKELPTERGVKMHHSQVHGESIAGETVSCYWCGDTTTVAPHQARENERNFCDDECRGEWLSETNTGENHNNYNKEKYTCDYCDEQFERIPAHVRGEHMFCSKGCSTEWRSENWRGEDNPLYDGGEVEGFTESERLEIFERDDFTCQDCGDDAGGNLNAHHIIPKSEDEELAHDVENGITLCVSCHAARHDEPISSFILSQNS